VCDSASSPASSWCHHNDLSKLRGDEIVWLKKRAYLKETISKISQEVTIVLLDLERLHSIGKISQEEVTSLLANILRLRDQLKLLQAEI